MDTSKSILNKFSLKRRGSFLGFGTSPQSDWKVIVGFSFLLTLGVVGMSLFIYNKIDKGEIFVIEKPTSREIMTLDTKLLRDVALYYQEKAMQLEEIKTDPLETVDPSL